MTRLIPILITCILIAACKKDKNDGPATIVGKWEEIENYSEGPGSCRCWKPVNAIGGFRLEFKKNGEFTLTPPMYYSSMYCPGDYHVEGDSLVWTNGSCAPNPPTLLKHRFILENKNTLLIKYHHIPNLYYEIRYKRVFNF